MVIAGIVTDERASTVCKMGHGVKACRYLTLGAEGFFCEKETGIGRTIDARVETGTITAHGDNCRGLWRGGKP